MEFTDYEYRSARRAAGSVARINKGYLDPGDVLGAIYEWMAQNHDKVLEWREEGSKGYFDTAVYRAGLRYALRERRARTGTVEGDLHFYTTGQVEDILPDCWDREQWAMITSRSHPAEGNNRLAMIIDVANAVVGLPVEDQELLRRRFGDDVLLADLALEYETTEDALGKRIRRINQKIVKALGGEPPWWGGPGSRTAKSNAQAQAEVST